MVPDLEELVTRAGALVREACRVVAFTGAGVSTESGIPDFRSPGGIWEQYEPVYFQDFLASEEARKKYWRRAGATYPVISRAAPNATHLALADLERMGKLDCVITQNIDRLHQKGGVSPERVIEIHGHNTEVICLDCRASYPREEVQNWLESGVEVPHCPRCGGLLKEATISFGQAMPEKEMAEAERRVRGTCDLLLTLGSSLVVYPAAYLPIYAHQAGASIIIINLAPTSQDGMADVVIHSRTGEVLPRIVEQARL